MNQELTEEELLYASEEDWTFYKEIADLLPSMAGKNNDGLDKFGEPIPYHSGPHILKHFRETIEIVKPKKILEIGFNMGHSSMMWLKLSSASVVSFDVSEKQETFEGATAVYDKYALRFDYLDRKYPHTHPLEGFDLCFIDGAHDEENIIKDIEWTKQLRIPYVLFDDWYPRYGETQKAVARFPELELVKDMNNLMLFKWKEL